MRTDDDGNATPAEAPDPKTGRSTNWTARWGFLTMVINLVRFAFEYHRGS